MLCDKCGKNNAEVFYKENINGKETKYSLCHECAEKMEKDGEISFKAPHFFDDGFGFPDFSGFGSLIGSMLAPSHTKGTALSQKKCDLCGMTFEDFMSEGKAGCPRCYDTFADELERTIAQIHGGTRHIGKTPEKYREMHEREDKVASLRTKLNEAVKAENYEEAAKLRDEIKGLESEENDNKGGDK